MGSIWKVVLSFAVIILITAVGITITSVNADVTAAGDYMEELSAVIRESNYNENVIRECQQEAAEHGYELEVEVYRNEDRAGNCYAKMSMRYPYRLPLFGIEIQKSKEKII